MTPSPGEGPNLTAHLEAAAGRLADLEAVTAGGTPAQSAALAGLADALRAATDAAAALQRETDAERARLEAQLRRAQRLEWIGRLAGGIAHDLNNLLGPVLGYAELACEQVPAADPLQADLGEIQKLAERARQLSRHLLAIARGHAPSTRVFSLNALLADMQTILRRTIREDVVIELRLAPDLGSVRADPSQIEQVVLNLAINAQDAMPGGGSLRIATESVLPAAGGWGQGELRADAYAVLAVTDTGCGMDEETLAHCFEPFFTTKGGRGTGLGLASAAAIVQAHGGRIEVQSHPQAGTTFRIFLPQVEEAPEQPAAASPAAARGGTETVLVAEDEEGVRNLVSHVLVRQGYEVIAARNGDEALWLAKQHAGPIHLLFTDVIMPGMNGVELYKCLRRARPDVKVLYMSGYGDGTLASLGIAAGELLQKPFSVQGLGEKVRALLDAPA